MIHRRTIDRKEKDMSFFQFSDEELRARFTNWLEKTLFRERIKYLIKSQWLFIIEGILMRMYLEN